MRRFSLLALILLVFVPAAADTDVASLVAKLGDDSWAVREDATMALIDAGEGALPALREAVGSQDAEVRFRSREAIGAIEAGLSAKGYRKFGNVAQSWAEVEKDEKQKEFLRLASGLDAADKGRVFARLAMTEEDDAWRQQLVQQALAGDAPRAMAIFSAKIETMDPKKDGALVVTVASWYQQNGQQDKALEVLDKVKGPMDLPIAMARQVGEIYASHKNWARAADAFGKLAEHPPAGDEAEAAGERIAYLKLAGDAREFDAALTLAAKADGDTRDRTFAEALDRLRREGNTGGAMEVASRGALAGSSGEFAVKAGQLFLSMGRDGDALLMFRRALKGVDTDSVLEDLLQKIREACASAGEELIATREFAAEMKEPAKSASAHATAARLLSEAGLAGAAAVEWRRAAALLPGSPVLAAEAARSLAAAGDPRAARWAATARMLAGPGAPEEGLAAAAVKGRGARVTVRRAVEAEFRGDLHVTCGDVAATLDEGNHEVIGFAPSGRVLWRWRWSEPQKQLPGRFPRTRDATPLEIAPLVDGFLVVVQEWDTVTSDMRGDTRSVGAWLVTLDAATGMVRTMAHADGPVAGPIIPALGPDRGPRTVNAPPRPMTTLADRVFVADVDLTSLVATDIATAKTAWIRPLGHYHAASDPGKVEVVPRLAAGYGLVFVPAPHVGKILALRATDGTVAWEAATPGPAVDVVLEGGALWAAAGDAVLKLDPATGREILKTAFGATVVGVPALRGDLFAARLRDGSVRGCSTKDGAEQWNLFVGPTAEVEAMRAAGGAFFLLRRGQGEGSLPSWIIALDGRPLRRFYVDFNAIPEVWRDNLLIDDIFGRRQPFCIPPGDEAFEPLFPSGLITIDGAAMVADDAGTIAALAKDRPPEVARALVAAALSADPENPAALALRVKFAPPPPKDDPGNALAGIRADAWRALDAFPPQDPAREAAVADAEAALKITLQLPLKFEDQRGAWTGEQRLWNAIARVRRNPADKDAIEVIGDSALRAAAAFLPPAAADPAAALARLRCDDAAALRDVLKLLDGENVLLRIEAARVLAWRPEPAAAAALRTHLADSEPVVVRLSAALAVGASESAALEILERYGLPADENPVFFRAASILLKSGRPRVIEALGAANNAQRNDDSGQSSLEILASSGIPAAVDHLASLINPRSPVCVTAAQALMAVDRPRAMRAMAEVFRKAEAGSQIEYSFLRLITPGDVPEVAPLMAERALQRYPGADDISQPDMHYVVAEALDASGKGAEARKRMDTYSEILPDAALTLNNSAWFLSISKTCEMTDGPRAVGFATRAVSSEPWNAGYWDTLGEAYRAAGDFEGAVAASGIAFELSPHDGASDGEAYYVRQFARMRFLRDTHGVSDGVAR